MLRPERMSKTTLLFLKSDTEEVLDSLSKQGAFHITIKSSETASDLLNRASALINRLEALIEQSRVISGSSELPPPQAVPIEAQDWTSFLGAIEKEISQYEHEIKEIDVSIKTEERLKSFIGLWYPFITNLQKTLLLDVFATFKRIAFLPLYQKESRPTPLSLLLPHPSLVLTVTSKPTTVLVACMKDDLDKLRRAAEEAGYAQMPVLDDMPDNFNELSKMIESTKKKLEEISLKNEEFRRSFVTSLPKLLYLRALLSDANSLISIKESATFEKRWMILEGYVPSKNLHSLIGDLQARLNGRIVFFSKEEHSSPQVPVVFKYPKFFKLFESITNLYGVPSYTELNPTPILAITFPVFFGLMFGDLGHGLMLAALGFIFYKYTKSMSKIGVFLMICGIAGAIVGAALYGEAFGKHIGYHTIFSPGEDLMSLFKFSLYIGVAQISLGLAIMVINNLIQKKSIDAFLVNAPKLLLYLLFMYVVFNFGLNLNLWFTGPIFYILGPAIFMLIGKPVWAFIRHGRKEFLSVFGEMGFEVFDTMIRFVSNTVSYLRIFAMVMAHIQLTAVFYSLGAIAGGGIVGMVVSALLAALGNIFVVLLEGILVLAQDLRLHFYEWFSKFYEDGGVRFSPFKLTFGVPILKR
ncbi:MAG: V-type ATPase 116kDa subunit family protein [Candidatus Methanomethylicaceae archaeon]